MILIGNWQWLTPPGWLGDVFMPSISKNMRHLGNVDALDTAGGDVRHIAQ
jgi:hypothetical protein